MMKQWIKEIARGRRGSKDLNYEEAVEAIQTIAKGNATDAQLGSFLTANRMKEETPEELRAFAEVFSSYTEKLNLTDALKQQVVDFASPYNGRHSFFATIPVSILLAERGVPAFLHSSKSLPPKYGTSLKEVLSGLGITTEGTNEELSQSLQEKRLAYAWTDQYCKPLAQIRQVREEIGVRTFFNTIEKLLNISGAKTIMFGAFHRTAINKILPMLSQLSFSKAFIVQGIEGSEDLPVHRNSFIFQVSNGVSNSFIVSPKDYGLEQSEESFSKKITLQQQIDWIQRILQSENSTDIEYGRAQVIWNAGVRYYLLGLEPSIEAGIAYAEEQLQSGRGAFQLKKWQEKTVMI
ncbi:anthranilate phosphoribosyltransferase [Bacillus tianshenii]|nr:anthranilate phosphoribosyltransferase [Bacillus tianshenii]